MAVVSLAAHRRAAYTSRLPDAYPLRSFDSSASGKEGHATSALLHSLVVLLAELRISLGIVKGGALKQNRSDL
jgi:hypothetical protein